MPEERGLYPKTEIFNQLMYFAKLKGMKVKEAAEAIDYWLKKTRYGRIQKHAC